MTGPGEKHPAQQAPPPTFFQWFPWEKVLIWGLFILAVYILRRFFFVIFMTFIVSYTMRGLVVRLSRLILPRRESVLLQRALAVISFAALLAALYGIGQAFVPMIIRQGEELVRRLGSIQESPRQKLDEILRDTWGRILFYQRYGTPGDPRYQEKFKEYQAQGLHYKQFEEFGRLLRRVEEEFQEAAVRELGGEEFQRLENADQATRDAAFMAWLKEEKAREVYEENPELHTARWRRRYEEVQKEFPEQLRPLEEVEKDQEYVRAKVLEDVAKNLAKEASTPQRRQELEKEWRLSLGRKLLAGLSPEERESMLQRFYEERRQEDPAAYPYEWSVFQRLRNAYKEGELAFSREWEALLGHDRTQPKTLEDERIGFELWARQQLIEEWKQGEIAQKLGTIITEQAVAGLTWVGRRFGEWLPAIFFLPVELALSLLLSFLITFDVPKLKRGIQRLKESRVRNLYEEIAPGLISFGKLIGRAFQAQGLIAICNTILTFIAIRLLGIENEVFLSAIVFVCSFIPVLGVVISSIPIAVMALVQDNGGFLLALSVIGAILLVHFIETSLLNPKILGDMMHLHPVLVLAILAVGEHFFGVWGLLLGVPVMVYIIRFVILDEGIPGVIEPVRPPSRARPQEPALSEKTAAASGS